MYSLVRHFTQLQAAKEITESVFFTAKKVEHEMQDIKDTLKGVPFSITLPPSQSRTLFGGVFQREITYYPVMHQLNDLSGNPTSKTIRCVVADVRPPEFEVPVIVAFDAHITVNGNVVNTAYAAESVNSSIYIETEAHIDKPHLLQTILYRWYATDSSFPIRWTALTDPDAPGVGPSIALPLRNFEIIPGATSQVLPIDTDRAGQHIVCVMTPASFDGKMGSSIFTRPLYIFGLPIIDNLAAHYDASLIDLPGDYNSLAVVGRVALRWPDISNNGAHADVIGNPPRLSSYLFPQLPNRDFPVIAQRVDYLDDRGMMSVNSQSFDPPFTMFAVVKMKGSGGRVIASRGSAWSFDGASYPGLIQDRWYILGLNSNGKRTVGRYADPPSPNNTASPLSGGGGAVRIGGISGDVSNIDLAELIIYSDLLPESQWSVITDHLGEKYNISGM